MKSGKMSVLSSIPARFRVVLIGVACLGISLISQAQIVLNVSGGTGDTPLTINITTGASFMATGDLTGGIGFAGVVFNDFWNNSKTSLSISASEATVSLGGVLHTSPNSTGAALDGPVVRADLILGFGFSSIANGDTAVLTTGTRVTGTSLTLDYTSINASGTARLVTDGGSAISDSSVTWTTVPEPSTYAAISGLVCLGGAIARRRFKRSLTPALGERLAHGIQRRVGNRKNLSQHEIH
ncbi:PEP-CTERM sorting domain-containing protein [bacterium]|nr:PEP-CTERM sorting domain-containing protein [bacterium]